MNRRANVKFPRFHFACKMKNGQVTIWVIIAMFLVGAVIVGVMFWGMWEPTNKIMECQTDFDCAPATCYDPNECVSKDFIDYPLGRTTCDNITFTEECSTTEDAVFTFSYLTENENEEEISISYPINYKIIKKCNVINECEIICDPLACVRETCEPAVCIITPGIDLSSLVAGCEDCNDNPLVARLPNCNSVRYIPDCSSTGVKINLDPRCGGAKGKCECDRNRNVCKVFS